LKRVDAHLEEFVDEELVALDSGVISAIDLGRLPGGLLDEQADKRVAPVAELHRVTLALAGVVVGGLYGLIVRHILDHHTGTGDSGGLPHGFALSLSLPLSLTLFLSLSLSPFRSLSLTHFLALSSPSRSFTQIETIILPLGVSRGARGHPGDECGGRADDRVSVTCGALLRHRRPYCPRGAAAAAPRVYTCAHAQAFRRRSGAARPSALALFHMPIKIFNFYLKN